MNISKELLQKAEKEKTAEELLTLAQQENIQLNEEQAVKIFAELHKTGELEDDELDNVAGGFSCDFFSNLFGNSDNDSIGKDLKVGDKVKFPPVNGVSNGIEDNQSTIQEVLSEKEGKKVFLLSNGHIMGEDDLTKI